MKTHFLNLVVVISLLTLFASCSSSDSVTDPTPLPTAFQVPATEDIVMYEINPSPFSASHDIQGIINRLDNIKALGINTIWIMPIFPVGEVNSFGSLYCVKDYTSVRTSLGTLQDFKDLVTAAHGKGIAVILDWVANHTSWDNAWITAHPDWYTQDGSGNIISPAGTGWNDVADLNFDNAAMRLAMIDAMKYWVEQADIDGFRCDAANYVPADFWQQALTALNAIPNKHLILLAEGDQPEQLTAGFQMNFAWNYMTTIKNVFNFNQQNVNTIFATNASEYAVVPSGKKKLRFTTNHDESNQATPITVYGSANGALAASVITIYMQGVPLIYCGQEVGVAVPSNYSGTSTINWNANAGMLSAYQKLLGFYNASTVARTGDLTNFSNADVVVFQKSNTTAKVLVVVNSRSASQSFAVPAELQGTWTNALTNASVTLSATLSLNGYQYLILKQ